MTDDSAIYPYAMKGTGLKHRTVTHSKGEYARYTKSGTINTNTVESAFEFSIHTPCNNFDIVILNPVASVSSIGRDGHTLAFSHSDMFPLSIPN